MTLNERAETFNCMVIEDARDEYGLIRHKLTYPECKPIPAEMLEHIRQEKAEQQASGKRWHPLAGTPAYAMYEDASYVGNPSLVAQVWRWLAMPGAPIRPRCIPTSKGQSSNRATTPSQRCAAS
jgi:hypothetical protein